MQIEYIRKNHPDLPEEFAVVDAPNVKSAFKQAVEVMQSTTPQLVVWDGAEAMFTAAERKAIKKSINTYPDNVDVFGADYSWLVPTFFNNYTLKKHFNLVAGCSKPHKIHEVANAAIAKSAKEVRDAVHDVSPLRGIVHITRTCGAFEKSGFHIDDISKKNRFFIFQALSGAINTIFVPDAAVGNKVGKHKYEIKADTERLWMLPKWSLAIMPPSKQGGMVHTAPSIDLNNNMISLDDKRRLEIMDIKTKHQLFPMR